MFHSDSGIHISYITPQTPLRLLELPHDILTLLESSSPPILKLKSAPSTSSSTPSHAVLCTPTQTYNLRQVQTSNSIYVLRPDVSTGNEYSMTITSTVTNTLELLPCVPAVIPMLYKTLPVYTGPSERDEEDNLGGMEVDSQAKQGYQSLIQRIPASEAEILTAWNMIGGFEKDGVAYRPSAVASLNLLQKIIGAPGIRLFRSFSTTSLIRALDDDESLPESFIEATLRQMCEKQQTAFSGEWKASREGLATLVGRLILEQDHDERRVSPRRTKDADMIVPELLKRWKSALPQECWELELGLETLGGWCKQPTALTVTWVEPGTMVAGTNTPVTVPANMATGKPKGKWHEKFAATKRK